jgi:hypothetical protein
MNNTLAQYGPEARPVREQIRSTVGPFADRLWHEKEASAGGPFETDGAAEQVYLDIQKSRDAGAQSGGSAVKVDTKDLVSPVSKKKSPGP